MTQVSSHPIIATWKNTLFTKKFDVYVNEQGDYQAVKQGSTWPGFFFSVIWALFYKLWFIAIVIIIAMSSLSYLNHHFSDVRLIAAYTGVIDLIIRLFIAINGNNWRRLDIQKKGFTFKETVIASSPDSAIWEILPKQIRQELEESPHHFYQLKRENYSRVISIIIGFTSIGIFYSNYGFLQSVILALFTIVFAWATVYAVLFPVGYIFTTNIHLLIHKLKKNNSSS